MRYVIWSLSINKGKSTFLEIFRWYKVTPMACNHRPQFLYHIGWGIMTLRVDDTYMRQGNVSSLVPWWLAICAVPSHGLNPFIVYFTLATNFIGFWTERQNDETPLENHGKISAIMCWGFSITHQYFRRRTSSMDSGRGLLRVSGKMKQRLAAKVARIQNIKLGKPIHIFPYKNTLEDTTITAP